MGISETIVTIALSMMLATGSIPTKASFNETLCLAEAVFFETSHRPRKEKEAVANVILNRRKSNSFPNDICAITYQKKQFNFQRPGKNKFITDKQIPNIEQSVSVALDAVGEGIKDNTGGATHFVNLSIATDTEWLTNMKPVKTIGPHTFYIEPRRPSSGSQKQDNPPRNEDQAR